MKMLLNITILLTFLALGMPQEVQASCCSADKTTCTLDVETDTSDQHGRGTPCGKSCCDCICCLTVSFLLLKKETSTLTKVQKYQAPIFQYKSLHDALFSASIWQPPRLG